MSFVLGAKIPDIPYAVSTWRTNHPNREMTDGQVFTQPWPAGPTDQRRDQVIHYQYKTDPARRTLRGIDEKVAKAEKAVADKVPVKRNWFITITGAHNSVNRTLEAKARTLAGLKGYVTNIDNPSLQFVIGSYHRIWHIEKSFRMSKRDLRARPSYHSQARIDRGAPHSRVRCAGGHPPDRGAHRLVLQAPRTHRLLTTAR